MKLIFVAIFTLFSSPVLIFSSEHQLLFGLKAHIGGDKIATIDYVDNTSQEILAGNGINFYGGLLFGLPLPGLQVKILSGYKYSSSKASNINVSKTAIPFEAGFRYDNKGFFAGAGGTFHLNPTLKIDNAKVSFDEAFGLYLETGWKFIYLGGTLLEYKAGRTFSASSFDFGFEFPIPFSKLRK